VQDSDVDHILGDEVFSITNNNKSMADLNHIVILIQYFFMVDGPQSICHFLKNHLLYDFLIHQEYRFVRETIIYLLSPGEQYLGLVPAISSVIAEYVRLTGWNDVLASNVNSKNPDKILEEKKRVTENPDIIRFVESLPERLKSATGAGGDTSSTSRQNILPKTLVRTDSLTVQMSRGTDQRNSKPASKYVEWLSGVLFGKNSRTSQPQPEELAMISNNGTLGNLKNIDMLPLELFKQGSNSGSMAWAQAGKYFGKQASSSNQDSGWDAVNDEVAKGNLSPESKSTRSNLIKRAGTTLNIKPSPDERQEKKFQFTTSVMKTISKLKGVAKWSALSKYISTMVSRKKAIKSKTNLDEMSALDQKEGTEDTSQEIEFLKLHTPGFNLQPAKVYPEKVETYNINILQEVRIFKDNFENNLKRERYILGVFEILRSSIFFVLDQPKITGIISDPVQESNSSSNMTGQNYPQRPDLQANKRFTVTQKVEESANITMLRDQFFRNTRLYEECLLSFMVRIEYKALNNIDITSIYTSASILVKILKNM
jgi:hypothetical protein